MERITPLLLIIIITSVLGFVTENIWIAIRYHFIDNRGMIFPALIGYGLAVAGIWLLFGTPGDPKLFGSSVFISNGTLRVLYFFLICCILVSAGEVILGTAVEHFCHIVWWNYESIPMHMGKYTSVPTTLGFALLISVFMNDFFAPLYRRACLVTSRPLRTTVVMVTALLVMDYIHSAVYMFRNHRLYFRWRRDLNRPRPGKILD